MLTTFVVEAKALTINPNAHAQGITILARYKLEHVDENYEVEIPI